MGRIIKVDGYRMFIGTMRILNPEDGSKEEVTGEWLYRPDTGCWYCDGRTYTWSMCTIVGVE